MQKADGMNYAPQGIPRPVVKAGEFAFGVCHLDHGHIFGMCNGLTEAGGELRYIFDPQPERASDMQHKFPSAQILGSEAELLDKTDIQLIAAAAVPSERGPLGCRVMEHGKDYFTDKTPFTTLVQLDQARERVKRTGKKYAVYYSERLHVECAVFAGQLINDGVIGRVIQVIGLGPHRHGAPGSRPAWFYEREKYGGILCDIGSHQVEQYLYYSGATDAVVNHAAVGNYRFPEYPEFEDYGEASLTGNNDTTQFYRVDWHTPDGLGTWGDGRTIILGTQGYIEMRKYIDVARDTAGNHLYLVNEKGEQHLELTGKVGYPYFGELILDSLNRTEKAMTQEHTFKAAELCLLCQEAAKRLG